MAFSIIMRADGLRSLAFGSISGTYAPIGLPFEHPMRVIKIANLTDATMTFSYDGVIDHEIIPEGGFVLIDFCTNQAATQGAFIAQGTVIWVKTSGSPTSGSVYVSAYYGRGD